MDLNYYDSPKPCAEVCTDSGRPSVKARLERQKVELETQLKRVNEALDALNANPEVARVLELVSKV